MAVPAFAHQEPDFVAYRLIRGRPLYRHDLVELEDRQQDRLAEQLAIFPRQLHAIPQVELEQHAIGRSDAQGTPKDWELPTVSEQGLLLPDYCGGGTQRADHAPYCRLSRFLDEHRRRSPVAMPATSCVVGRCTTRSIKPTWSDRNCAAEPNHQHSQAG
jgi:hypothetical protein